MCVQKVIHEAICLILLCRGHAINTVYIHGLNVSISREAVTYLTVIVLDGGNEF